MKKILALILTLFIAVCACGCSFNGESTTGNENNSANESIISEILSDMSNTSDSSEESSQIVSQESSEETESEETLPAWKQAYIDFVNENYKSYPEFMLIYLDNNNIPELYLSGDCEATGSMICTYYNGKIVECYLRRLSGDTYIPKSGLIMNVNGNMGYYSHTVYRLNNGKFTELFLGYEEEDEYSEELEYFTYKFSINDREVPEEEFYAQRDKVFDSYKAKDIYVYDNMYSRKNVIEKIKNW